MVGSIRIKVEEKENNAHLFLRKRVIVSFFLSFLIA